MKRSSETRFLPGAYVFPGGRVDPDDSCVELKGGEHDRKRMCCDEAAAYQVAAIRETEEECGVRLGVSQIAYWSWWLTPKIEPRRYDTRFFIANVGAEAVATHDNVELIESAWWSPVEALRRLKAGEIFMAPPTWITLMELSAFQNADDVLRSAGGRTTPCIEPMFVANDNGNRILLPSAEGHWSDEPVEGPNSYEIDDHWRPI